MPQPLLDLPLRTLRLSDHVATAHAVAWALEEGSVGASQPVIHEFVWGDGTWVQSYASSLWLGVPTEGSLATLLSLLTDAERQQIFRLRNNMDRWSVAAGRAVARILLGQCLDCPAQDVALIQEERGKPMLDPGYHGAIARQLHFSISHSRELVAVAVARSRVGVDVEAVRVFPELMQVADALFAREMFDELKAAENDGVRIALFYRFWTLGEAFIKATGEGLTQGLKSFAFTARNEPALIRVDAPWGPRDRWCFGTLAAGRIRL